VHADINTFNTFNAGDGPRAGCVIFSHFPVSLLVGDSYVTELTLSAQTGLKTGRYGHAAHHPFHCWSVLNVRKVRKCKTRECQNRLKDTRMVNGF